MVELVIAEGWVKGKEKKESCLPNWNNSPPLLCLDIQSNDDIQLADALVKHGYSLAHKWKLMCENYIH